MRILILACALTLSACTTIKLNGDNTNSITHEGGAAEGKKLADRACEKAGESSAVIVSTVNKDPSLPEGTGRQVTTFHCSSDKH
ncbi:MAG: hypothetical protein ACJ8OJ_18875 [Povalibacter sp.]